MISLTSAIISRSLTSQGTLALGNRDRVSGRVNTKDASSCAAGRQRSAARWSRTGRTGLVALDRLAGNRLVLRGDRSGVDVNWGCRHYDAKPSMVASSRTHRECSHAWRAYRQCSLGRSQCLWLNDVRDIVRGEMEAARGVLMRRTDGLVRGGCSAAKSAPSSVSQAMGGSLSLEARATRAKRVSSTGAAAAEAMAARPSRAKLVEARIVI